MAAFCADRTAVATVRPAASGFESSDGQPRPGRSARSKLARCRCFRVCVVGRAERQRIAVALIASARTIAADHGYRVFGELSKNDVVEFGLEDETGAHRSEVQVSLGGMLTVLTSNGYEFVDINNDWDVDGTPSPQVQLAIDIFDGFVAGDFRLTHGLLKQGKYMEFASHDLPVGRSTRHGIGNHRGGPDQRRRDAT